MRSRSWSEVAATLIMISFVGLIIISMVKDVRKINSKADLCEPYGNRRIQYIPAKCLKYFGIDR